MVGPQAASSGLPEDEDSVGLLRQATPRPGSRTQAPGIWAGSAGRQNERIRSPGVLKCQILPKFRNRNCRRELSGVGDVVELGKRLGQREVFVQTIALEMDAARHPSFQERTLPSPRG